MDAVAFIIAALLCIFTGNARADPGTSAGPRTEQPVAVDARPVPGWEPVVIPKHIGAAAFEQNMICGAFMGRTDYNQKVEIIRRYGRDAVRRCFL